MRRTNPAFINELKDLQEQELMQPVVCNTYRQPSAQPVIHHNE